MRSIQTKISFLAALALSLFTACGSSDSDSGINVYVAANAYYSDTLKSAVVFKNGDLIQRLSNELSTAMSVFVSGNDVYVAGCTGDYVPNLEPDADNYTQCRATLWKNGTATQLSDSNSVASSVYVSGNDVYVAGWVEVNNTPRATLWKNGTATQLSNNFSEAKSVFVSEYKVNNEARADVYVAGTCVRNAGEDDYRATLWNSTNDYTPNNFGASYSVANSVQVVSVVNATTQAVTNTVHTVGHLWNNAWIATRWQNNTATSLMQAAYNNYAPPEVGQSTSSSANSAFALNVNGNITLYMVGDFQYPGAPGENRLLFWPGTGYTFRMMWSRNDSSAQSLFVTPFEQAGFNVYAAGYEADPQTGKPRITLWKDGAASYLTGDGITSGYATSVVVK